MATVLPRLLSVYLEGYVFITFISAATWIPDLLRRTSDEWASSHSLSTYACRGGVTLPGQTFS